MTRPDLYKNNDNLISYDGFKHFGILNKYLNYLFWGVGFKEFWKHLRSQGDIIHYVSPSINPLVFNEKSIITMHDNPRTLLSDLYIESSLRRRTIKAYIEKYKNFYHTIADSIYIKDSLIDYGFESEIEVIYLPVTNFKHLSLEKTNLRSKLNLPLDKKLVLSISTLQKRKNSYVIPRIMEELGSSFQLVRIGEPLSNCVTFSHIDNSLLNEIYNACDVLIFPSLEEGFGYPIAEAMTVGLPVVANNFRTARELGKNAIVICENDIKSYAEGIKQAIEESDKLVKNGFLQANNFTMEKFQNKMKKFYEGI